MNLQTLELFCEIVRRQSFSRAARALEISQPAASQLIAHLEREIGFRLIDRGRRPLTTTPEGERYYEGCQDLVYRHRRLLDEVRRGAAERTEAVRVAAIYSVGLHTLSGSIQAFMSRYAGATVRLEYCHPSKVNAAVLDGEVDLGVTSYPHANRDLVVRPWVEEAMVFACPPEHRLAARRMMRLKDLDGERFVAFDPDLPIRRKIDQAFRAQHVRVSVLSEFDNVETIKQAVEVSQAVTILPAPSIERELQRGTLATVPVADLDLRRPVGIIHRRRQTLTRTARQFLDSLIGDTDAARPADGADVAG